MGRFGDGRRKVKKGRERLRGLRQRPSPVPSWSREQIRTPRARVLFYMCVTGNHVEHYSHDCTVQRHNPWGSWGEEPLDPILGVPVTNYRCAYHVPFLGSSTIRTGRYPTEGDHYGSITACVQRYGQFAFLILFSKGKKKF